ncbi:SIR2 family protein [Arcicella lustrica]|uniref:SIR2 family protein n=1 Tax=Arcicella lustrica TaxID=2984196 RepID=A0ABU5SJU0_9BACT|nr:SIR2 family protein [Arcicella sp. DC25W]MEA5427557.1 SIR2 family protein [Arcicella sp. DC25W]
MNKINHLKTESIEVFYQELIKYANCKPTIIHKKIGELSNRIITTNYDELLEKALPDFEKIVYTNTFKVAKLSDYDKYIYKIHGDINEPDKCILFPSEYENLYSTVEKSSIFEFKKIVSDKSILFLGFSLNDPYINYVLDYISNIYSGFNPEHFIITTQKNKSWPNKITPIIIEDYNKLDELLDKLIKIKVDQTTYFEEIESELKGNSSNSPNQIIKLSKTTDFDSPPSNKYWVGRSKELRNIGNDNFKVIFITGIGGQGKSALAAHYLRNHFDSSKFEFADWRDFKEETNRFQTKLLSIIQRLTDKFDIATFETISNHDLVDVFFEYLGDRKIIFVFDNVDSYIDLVTFKPTGSLSYFFEQILNKNHNSKFIFTCRPFIREAGINFYQISLSGILETECEKLFEFYKIPISKSEMVTLSSRAHKLTKGHPLWLNLIAGQAIRGIQTVNNFINSIENKSNFNEDNFSAILSEKILNEVWNSLNDKQKLLIRGLSETVKPENEENLRNILDSELNGNQFIKSLRVLKNLNLIETLSDGEIELHPLVKEFVLTKYHRNERAKFITLFVKFYDKFIYILKPKLNSNLTISEFQNWTLKIELQINKNDFKSALISLEEVRHAIITAGFLEEYLRVAELLYNKLNWNDAISQEYPYFHSQFITLTTIQTQIGKFDLCSTNLNKYSKIIAGKSIHYLAFCSQKCYFFWYQGLFNEAIAIAEEGVFLLEESSLTDNFSLRHNLALSLRDSKNENDIKKALDYFLQNESLDKVINRDQINFEFSSQLYGNVGKCLELIGRYDDALYCYCISFKKLLNENYDDSTLNNGYASFWIAEILFRYKKFKDGFYFLKYAEICWEKTSPPRLKLLKKTWSDCVFDKVTKDTIQNMTTWQVESYCKSFINQELI